MLFFFSSLKHNKLVRVSMVNVGTMETDRFSYTRRINKVGRHLFHCAMTTSLLPGRGSGFSFNLPVLHSLPHENTSSSLHHFTDLCPASFYWAALIGLFFLRPIGPTLVSLWGRSVCHWQLLENHVWCESCEWQSTVHRHSHGKIEWKILCSLLWWDNVWEQLESKPRSVLY